MKTTKKRPKLNTVLLLKIADRITRYPKKYDQQTFCTATNTECGTAHCIAGWAIRLKHPRVSDKNFRELLNFCIPWGEGRRILRLTPKQADYLFSVLWKPWNDYDTVPEALRKLCTKEGRRECKAATGVHW